MAPRQQSVVLAVACAGVLMASPQVARAGACADLTGLREAGVSITSADAVTPSPLWSSPAQPAYGGQMRTPFCRVVGLIENDIGFEVWLPPAGRWNGRFLGAGVGGNAGMYNYVDMARAAPMGFAAATTDSGHKFTDARWMMDPRKQENYAHRAEHLMTVAAKAVVRAYYGRPTAYDYFLGCSGGGRQALKEAQVYPEDYDGIIAGAPGPDMPMLSARHLWTALYQQRNPAGALSDADWSVVSDAVTAQCDKLDGVADGVVEDPRVCHFDPISVQCREGASVGCLPEAKVAAVRAIYAPLVDEGGRQADQGLFPGVRTRPGPPPPLLLELFGQGVHHDPAWNPASFNISEDVAAVYRTQPQLTANNPDLRPFRARGGKLIIYNGWADASVIAQQALGYYAGVQDRMGPKATATFTRLYMAPGVYHCRGGPGPDLFGGSGAPSPTPDAQHDLLQALVEWVERGHAPDQIIASKVEDDRVVRTRPLCAFPAVARYRGRGDTNLASSFACRAP